MLNQKGIQFVSAACLCVVVIIAFHGGFISTTLGRTHYQVYMGRTIARNQTLKTLQNNNNSTRDTILPVPFTTDSNKMEHTVNMDISTPRVRLAPTDTGAGSDAAEEILHSAIYRANATSHPEVTYLVENPHICQSMDTVSSVVLIYSAIQHFYRRDHIRKTWGNPANCEKNNMTFVFLVGVTEDSAASVRLRQEIQRNSDIVQGDFKDTYRNLTYKGILGYKWVAEHCMKARMVLKIDDDVFLNMRQISKLVSDGRSFPSNHFDCQVRSQGNSAILRSGKWTVPDSVFPNLKYFPVSYCNGFFLVTSPEVVSALYQASQSAYYVWVDDVYLFGVLPAMVGKITFKQTIGNYVFSKDTMIKCLMKPECEQIMVYVLSDDDLQTFWDLSEKSANA